VNGMRWQNSHAGFAFAVSRRGDIVCA
jgi:hypothetical protein